MDDGADGQSGISLQAINARLKKWALNIDNFCPGTYEWLDCERDGLSAIYGRLIDVGDLQRKGFLNAFQATKPHVVPVSTDRALIAGFYDCSDKSSEVCGFNQSAITVSGLASIVSCDNGSLPNQDLWWEKTLEYRPWENAQDFNNVLFANAKSSRWSLRKNDVWGEAPYWHDDLSLARIDFNDGQSKYFLARHSWRHVELSEIDWSEAQSFFFFLRHTLGNDVTAKYQRLDNKHIFLCAPIGFLPGSLNRFLDVATWPEENASDRFRRIARTETLPLIEELLAADNICLKETENG
jgi:hypothetical protein